MDNNVYKPNVEALKASDEVKVTDIKNVYLAEFSEDVPIRELLMVEEDVTGTDDTDVTIPEVDSTPVGDIADDPLLDENFKTRPVLSASGVRLHRVFDHKHNVVTAFDNNTRRTSLDFIGEQGAVLAVTHPGNTYRWSLVAVSKADKGGDIANITGVRFATYAESKKLDAQYPGWLAACRKFDEAKAEEAKMDALRKQTFGRGVTTPNVFIC